MFPSRHNSPHASPDSRGQFPDQRYRDERERHRDLTTEGYLLADIIAAYLAGNRRHARDLIDQTKGHPHQ